GPFVASWDGDDAARMVRGFLRYPNGAAAICLMYGLPSQLSALDLLIDVYTAMRRETPQIWDFVLSRVSVVERAAVLQQLADPQHQREQRQRVWLEVGISIAEHDDPAAVFSQQQQPVAVGNGGAARPVTNGAVAHGDA